jgi:hypothetical protein
MPANIYFTLSSGPAPMYHHHNPKRCEGREEDGQIHKRNSEQVPFIE